MSRQYRVLCGTPKEHCFGSKLITDQAIGSGKCHRTHDEAFKCYANYLVNVLGYKRLSAREFQLNDEPVLVLTKKMRYGAHLRWGKERGRFMPSGRSGNRGVVIS